MNLMTMQFGSFVFPVNPTELKLERACLLRETVGVDGEERVEAVGKRKARVAGKGHFTGENAMAVYCELEALFGETDTLYLPGHRPFEAVLSELALIGVPEKNTVPEPRVPEMGGSSHWWRAARAALIWWEAPQKPGALVRSAPHILGHRVQDS